MYYDFPLAVYYPTWLSDSRLVTHERTTPRAFFPFGEFITNSNISISCKGIEFTAIAHLCAAAQQARSSVVSFLTCHSKENSPREVGGGYGRGSQLLKVLRIRNLVSIQN